MKETLLIIGDVILLTSFPALALFVGFYFAKSSWRTLLVGRALMYFALSMMLVVLTVSLSLWLGSNYPFREWVRLFSYSLVSVTTWRLFFTLRYIQKQQMNDEQVKSTTESE